MTAQPDSLLPMIPTDELPLLVAALETHARRNYERCWELGVPDYVIVWSRNEGARYSREARRVRWEYLNRRGQMTRSG